MSTRSALTALFRSQNQQPQPKWQGTQPLTSNVILQALGLNDYNTSVATPEAAMGISAAARATQILAGSVAGAQKVVQDKRTGIVNETHTLIHEPHPMMNEFTFWELVMSNLIYEGNFYAVLQFGPGPKSKRSVVGMTPLDPTTVMPKAVISGTGKNARWTDTLYCTRIGNEQVGIPADEILHVQGLGFDGLKGISLLTYARRVFESTASSDEFANKFYANGSLMSGILTTDKRLDEKAAEGLKQRWRKKVQGIGNAFDIVVLDSNTKFEQISLSPQDAQWLESRKFNVNEMARIFGVHPTLLMETDSKDVAPEQKTTDFVAFTLNNWTARIEAACAKSILPDGEKLVILTKQLIQPDMRTRSSASVMWRKAQVKSINELRAEEGLPRIDDERADDPFYIAAAAASGAAAPGTNLGQPEEPVPAAQEPTDPPSGTDQNIGD